MESVFVTENPTDIDLFVNECNEVQKLKIGEIFQLKDNSLLLCCIHCLQEFQYFTEFSLHIQEHFLRGEVAQSKEIKEFDSINLYEERELQNVNEPSKPGVEEQIFAADESVVFDEDLDLLEGWSEEKFENSQNIFEPEINVKNSLEKLPEPSSFIEGTDYEKSGDTFRCLICAHESTKCELFRDHLLTHTNAPNILCPLCSKAFTTVSYVRKHVNRTHKMKITADKIRESQPSFSSLVDVSPVKPLETRSFVEGEDYEKINGRFKCLTCCREMLDHIKEHLLTHSNAKDVYCPICDKPFIAVSYVRKHVNRAHKMKITAEEIKAAQTSTDSPMDTENFGGNQLPSMVLSSRIENPQKNFECFDCHRQFMGLSSLRIHLKLHSGVKYSCPYCGKVFAMRSYVRDHIVALHGIRREEIPKDSIRQATGMLELEPRPNVDWFECNLCKNRYSKKQTLRQHIKTHTSGPFLCVICGAVYKSIASLRYHTERHQADPDNRHKCLYASCDKTYPTRRYMLSHYRTIHLNKRKRKPKINKPKNGER